MNSNQAYEFCKPCADLCLITSTSKPHNNLLYRGKLPNTEVGGYEQQYRCSECNTLWLVHVCKWGIHGAFRLSAKAIE